MTSSDVRFGVTLPAAGALAAPDDLTRVAALIEAVGFDSAWVTDHVAMPVSSDSLYPYGSDGQMTWPAATPWLDPLTALAWAAAATSTIRLGTSVLVASLRHPLLLAKQAATLDYLAQGRLVLGVGAGWLAEEFALVDQPFRNRHARLEEQIDLLKRCWDGAVEPFDGTFYRLDAFVMAPVPPRGSRTPIYVGGAGKLALRAVARRGDGWHPTHITPARYGECVGELERLLELEGRSLDEIALTVRHDGSSPLDDALVEEFALLGVELIVFDPDYSHGIERACDEIEAAADRLVSAPRTSTIERSVT